MSEYKWTGILRHHNVPPRSIRTSNLECPNDDKNRPNSTSLRQPSPKMVHIAIAGATSRKIVHTPSFAMVPLTLSS